MHYVSFDLNHLIHYIPFLCPMRKLVWITIICVLVGCAESDGVPAKIETRSTANVEYSKLFSITQESGFLSVQIFSDTLKNKILFDTQIPIQSDSVRVAALSTTHASFLNQAGGLQSLVGQAYGTYIRNLQILDHLRQNEVVELSGQADADVELLIDLDLDYYLVYPYGDDDYSLIQKSGVYCVPICEYLEQHPLARAEWIKLVGALVGEYDQACSEFERIEKEYEGIVLRIEENRDEYLPLVFTGSYDQGKWFAPSPGSYIAQYIRDAGAEYLFDDVETFTDDQSGNIELEFELMFDQAQRADWWGKVLYSEGLVSPADLIGADERLAELKCFNDSSLFYCNTNTSDYFGDGVIEPHVMLGEIASILHPEIVKSENPKYFQSLKESQ